MGILFTGMSRHDTLVALAVFFALFAGGTAIGLYARSDRNDCGCPHDHSTSCIGPWTAKIQ